MQSFYERYKQGSYQAVYDELCALGTVVYDAPLYDDALSVSREMMRRVRFNLQMLLIPRLRQMGYLFGAGAWDHPDTNSAVELQRIQQAEPIFSGPTAETSDVLDELAQLVGSIPLTLRCWYEEVGSINLIGAFPTSQRQYGYKRGYGLDPLYTQPLKDVFEEISDFEPENEENVLLPISPDGDLKYGYSGGGDYEIKVPARTFDGLLLGEEHNLTFGNYLRLCMQWGGFPGLEKQGSLSPAELQFLTHDLLPF